MPVAVPVGYWPIDLKPTSHSIDALHNPKAVPEQAAVVNAVFVILPKRWVVERTHSWTERWRRTVIHHDRKLFVSAAWVWLAEARTLLIESLIRFDFVYTQQDVDRIEIVWRNEAVVWMQDLNLSREAFVSVTSLRLKVTMASANAISDAVCRSFCLSSSRRWRGACVSIHLVSRRSSVRHTVHPLPG